MSTVGQRERQTQARVIRLFHQELGYDYLGNWIDRENNRNIEEDLLRDWLKRRGYADSLITRALHQLGKAAALGEGKHLYDANKAVYELLRYGVKVKKGAGEQFQTVWLIDWADPEANDFAIAEEVTITGEHTKRPDIVLYVNGIALGVLELKRSTVAVSEGIRQNLDNQKKTFIRAFFTTQQLLMAGNDTEGLRYGTIETPEKYYLTWKEEGAPEPEPGTLLDTYIQAEESRVLSKFDELGLVELLVRKGPEGLKALPEGIRADREAMAETIENNLRKLIIDEQPVNPKYYEKMSELLDALIEERRQQALEYEEYLKRLVELSEKVTNPAGSSRYPPGINSPARRALYDNLKDRPELEAIVDEMRMAADMPDSAEFLALAVDKEVRHTKKADWRGNRFKEREVRNAIAGVIGPHEELVDLLFEIVKNQDEY